MSDLVARLRQVKSARQQGFYTIHEPDALANEAADMIEAQAAQITALQAQLAEALGCVEAMNHTTIFGHAVQDGAIDDEYCDEFRDIHTSMIETVLKARAIRAMKGE